MPGSRLYTGYTCVHIMQWLALIVTRSLQCLHISWSCECCIMHVLQVSTQLFITTPSWRAVTQTTCWWRRRPWRHPRVQPEHSKSPGGTVNRPELGVAGPLGQGSVARQVLLHCPLYQGTDSYGATRIAWLGVVLCREVVCSMLTVSARQGGTIQRQRTYTSLCVPTVGTFMIRTNTISQSPLYFLMPQHCLSHCPFVLFRVPFPVHPNSDWCSWYSPSIYTITEWVSRSSVFQIPLSFV